MANTNIDGLYSGNTGTITTSTAIKGKSAEDMGMNEFMDLLVAQMTNQDMMNPESNTEFIAQMAQFSSLKGIQTIQEYQLSNYAVSYTGKTVTIASINESTGNLDTINGIVEKVTFYNGSPQVHVNGKAYPIHQIMEVNSPDTTETIAGNALNQVAGYIGKFVTVTDISDPDNPKSVIGAVTSVTLKGGKPYVIVDYEREYPASAITEVSDTRIVHNDIDTNTNTNTDTDTDTDTDTGTGIDTDTDTDIDTDTDTDTDNGIYDTDD